MADTSSEHTGLNKDFTWKDFKQFQHRYLVNLPNCPEDIQSYADVIKNFNLPYPISSPIHIKDFELYMNIFKRKSGLDTRLEYYRKLFLKNKLYKKNLKHKKVAELPKYILDVIQNTADENSNCSSLNYSGGVLDTFELNGKDYTINSGVHERPQIREVSDCSRLAVNLNIRDTQPVYCIKTSTTQNYVLVSLRHKYQTSVVQLTMESDILKQDLLCRTRSHDVYSDMNFNYFQNKEYATLTNTYKLRIVDMENSKVRLKYIFDKEENDSFSDPNLAPQIEFMDSNTLCFMNYCCVYFLDLRSLQKQRLCLRNSWLECDNLCCLSKSKNSSNCLYVASKHKLIHVDARLLKNDNHTMHMLSTPPFITTTTQAGFEDVICLQGEQINDRVLIQDNGTLSTPVYIPNAINTLTKTSLTKKFTFSEDLEERFCLPIIGLKLHKDVETNDLVLYSSNAAGDIFKQKFLSNQSDDINAAEKLADWIKVMPRKSQKVLEVTSVRNLNKIMHVITNNFPHEGNLKRLMGNDVSQPFKKRFGDVSKYLHNSVGEAINAIWDPTVVDADNLELPALTQNKVSDWLSSVG